GHERGRPDRRALGRSARSRPVPARLPSAVAVLPPDRARGRDRRPRAALPHPAPRLLVRVRELPRQLSADELAELFEGRTRFVELLAVREHPLAAAREVARSLSDADKKE